MKGDFTRRTFRPEKHYSGVRMQQGRMQLDADWNEQVEIQQYALRSETRDLIGQSGVPAETPNGFAIQVNNGILNISAGHLYVDGILCTNDQDVRYDAQPDYPIGALNLNTTLTSSAQLLYLDVWERHVTSLEDPDLIEVALGGADTATRSQILCQVKLQPAANLAAAQALNLYDRIDRRAGIMVRIDGDGPPPGNYLYRIEIHQRTAAGGPSFKWSRENGSIAAEWIGGRNPIEVRGRTRLSTGQVVELNDDTHELLGQPGVLRSIASVEDIAGLQRLTLSDAAGNLPALIDTFRDDNLVRKKKVRLWETEEVRFTPGTEVVLRGGGLLVNFAAANYDTGDAWIIPVRQGVPQAPARVDIEHHYAKLAFLQIPAAGQPVQVTDLRRRFASLPDLQAQIDNLRINAVPEGVITMWSGSIANIPTGWRLCDGQNGTPDLRSRFILGAGAAAPYRTPGATGGSETHTHNIDVPAVVTRTADEGAHTHSLRQDYIYYTSGGAGRALIWDSNLATGTGSLHSHAVTIDPPPFTSGTNASTNPVAAGQPPEVGLPPWYALCFIIRVRVP